MRNRLLYGVIGTQNTGKSTFIGDVIDNTRNRYEKFRFTNDSVDYRKKITELGLEINRNGNEKCQRIIFDTLFENVISQMSDVSGCNKILDRTPLDAYVYSIWHNVYGNGGISDEFIQEAWTKTVYSMRVFDRIFWIPLEKCGNVKVVDDKFRDTNLEYRKEIDGLFRYSIERLVKNGVSNISMIYGGRDERVEMFRKYELEDSTIQ